MYEDTVGVSDRPESSVFPTLPRSWCASPVRYGQAHGGKGDTFCWCAILQRLTPSGSVLAFYTSGEEVGYLGLHAGRRVHDRVGKLMREEVGIVRVGVPRGGNREIARLAGGRSDR